jgi:hypothetical protein
VFEQHEERPRRRKCRRPRFASEDRALRYARMVLRESGRTAYECSAHVPHAFHLHPKGYEPHGLTPPPSVG